MRGKQDHETRDAEDVKLGEDFTASIPVVDIRWNVNGYVEGRRLA